MQLIYTHHWGGEPCGGTTHIPFEYESKEQFVFDVLEKFKDHKWQRYGDGSSDYETSTVNIFDNVDLTKGDLESIEHNVSTLEEWFKRNEEKPTVKPTI